MGAGRETRGLTSHHVLRAGALAALYTAALIAALAGVQQFTDAPLEAFASVALLLATPVAAVVAITRVTLFEDTPDRRVWRAASHAALALLVGEACELAWRYGFVPYGRTLLAIQLTAFVLAAVFGALAVRRVVGRSEGLGDNSIGNALDIVIILLAVFVLMLTLFLPTLRQDAGMGYAQSLGLALMPSLSVALVLYATAFKRTPWHGWQVLATGWVALLGTKDTLAAALAPRTYAASVPPSLAVDVLFVFGYALAVAAALERLREGSPASMHARGASRVIWPALAAPATLTFLSPLIYNRLTSVFWEQTDIWIVVGVSVGIGLGITARSHMIAAENSSLRRHATTDPLTGLYNHRHFHERLAVGSGTSRGGAT